MSSCPILSEHTPKYFNEVVLPFAYDSEAQCPLWRRFLDQALPRTGPNDRRQEVMQEYFGYTLLRDCRYERMLMLLGDGANGKGVALATLESVLGADNVKHLPYTQLGAEYRLSELQGALANISSELTHLGKADEGLLKQLISGEPVNVNRKYKTPLEVRLSAKLVVACNELPSFSDTTDGVWRRLLIVPFNTTFAEANRDTNLKAKLAKERAGVFNWMLDGLRRLMRQDGFSRCQMCDEALGRHRLSSDSLREFLDECCQPERGGVALCLPLYRLYAYFCEQTGRRNPIRNNLFGSRIQKAGYPRRRVTMGMGGERPWVYDGLGLSEQGQHYVVLYGQDKDRSRSHSLGEVVVRPAGCPGSPSTVPPESE